MASKEVAIREVELAIPLGLTPVEEIIWAESLGDAAGWWAAKRYASLLKSKDNPTGLTQQQLAKQVGKSQQHVSRMKRLHEDRYSDQSSDLDFTEAYQALCDVGRTQPLKIEQAPTTDVDPDADIVDAEIVPDTPGDFLPDESPDMGEPDDGCPIASWPAQLKNIKKILGGYVHAASQEQAADLIKVGEAFLRDARKKAKQ